jgi:hypothetical protein
MGAHTCGQMRRRHLFTVMVAKRCHDVNAD